MSAELDRFLEEARLDPEWNALGLTGGEVVSRSRTTSVFRISLAEGGAVYVKQYRYPTWRDAIRGMFRGTLFGRDKASREFENLRRMRAMGWPVPRPVLCGRKRGAVFLKACHVATSEIEEAVRADLFLARNPPPSPKERKEAIEAGAELVASMHRAGYTDGSLALRNVLLVREGKGVRVFKVDCAKGRWKPVAGRGALEDLARLYAGAASITSLGDRLRFLRTYLGRRLGQKGRRWVESIEAAREKYDIWERPRLSDPGGPLAEDRNAMSGDEDGRLKLKTQNSKLKKISKFKSQNADNTKR